MSRASPAGLPLLSAAIMSLQRKLLPQKKTPPSESGAFPIILLKYF
jgi:hypothetical protein